jgi:N-acetylmuramoyl-L-alanine amidase
MDNLKKFTIVIDEGHGGIDPGAVDVVNEIEGDYILTIEKDLNKKVGDKVIAKLKALQANVISTRTIDKYVSLGERCRIANISKANIFVSIHFNAGTSLASGIETFIYRNAKNPLTKKLGENIQTALINSSGLKNRGLKTSDFYVLKNTIMSAVLVELGFITNTKEEQLINTDSFQENVANSIVSGIIKTLILK